MVSLCFCMPMTERRFISGCGVLCLLAVLSCTTFANTPSNAGAIPRTPLPTSSKTVNTEPIARKDVLGQISVPAIKLAAPEVALPSSMAPALALRPEGAVVLIGPVVDALPPPKQAVVANEGPAALAPRMALIPNAPYKAPSYPN